MTNMVPYCQGKWYHILLVNGTIFFSKKSLFQNQRGYDSISILAFSNFKKAIDACGAGLHVEVETRRYAPEHEVLGNTQNTQKKGDCMWVLETTEYTE